MFAPVISSQRSSQSLPLLEIEIVSSHEGFSGNTEGNAEFNTESGYGSGFCCFVGFVLELAASEVTVLP